MAKFWSIGPIRGEYQPESFTETQDMNVTDKEVLGNVSSLEFKSWKPREVSLSFVVNWGYRGQLKGEITANDRKVVLPQAVWDMICNMVRPFNGSLPVPVDVTIAGWGEGSGRPKKAIVTSASINRTHISGDNITMRATINATLRELAIGSGGDVESAIADFQEGAEEPGAEQGTPENPLGTFGEIFPR